MRGHMDRQAFHEALESIWVSIRAANGYVDQQAPWALRKTDEARMRTVLYVLAETIRRLTLYVQPFMPESTGKILEQLSVPSDARDFTSLESGLQAGTALPKPAPVFPRFVEEETAEG